MLSADKKSFLSVLKRMKKKAKHPMHHRDKHRCLFLPGSPASKVGAAPLMSRQLGLDSTPNIAPALSK